MYSWWCEEGQSSNIKAKCLDIFKVKHTQQDSCTEQFNKFYVSFNKFLSCYISRVISTASVTLVHHRCQWRPFFKQRCKYLETVLLTNTELDYRCHFRFSRRLYILRYKRLRGDKRVSENIPFICFSSHEACSFGDVGYRFYVAIAMTSPINTHSLALNSVKKGQMCKETSQKKKIAEESCGF